jgi:phage-related protein
LSDDVVSRYLTVSAPDISFDYTYRFGYGVDISFLVVYPFWLDYTETSDPNVLAGNATFYTDATGSDFIIFPTFTILNSADNPGIYLRNISDGSMNLTYNDTEFYNGDTLVINCAEGTVYKNNNNAIENLVTPSRFLRLQPLNNEILYEGNACTITVTFRKAYLI